MAGTKRIPIVAGNWKMNGDSSLCKVFSQQLKMTQGIEVIIFPPSCYLSNFAENEFALGVQDVSQYTDGAYTGNISTKMIRDLGSNYALVGHSERRQYHFESNEIVGRKASACIENQVTPIICVGESLETRESGLLFEFISEQIAAVVDECGIDNLSNAIIAYEPIWAIGTGKTASPEQAQEVHAFIRNELCKRNEQVAAGIRILYGGSVNAKNASLLFSQPDIDGGLVGGASLNVEDFKVICQAAS